MDTSLTTDQLAMFMFLVGSLHYPISALQGRLSMFRYLTLILCETKHLWSYLPHKVFDIERSPRNRIFRSPISHLKMTYISDNKRVGFRHLNIPCLCPFYKKKNSICDDDLMITNTKYTYRHTCPFIAGAQVAFHFCKWINYLNAICLYM